MTRKILNRLALTVAAISLFACSKTEPDAGLPVPPSNLYKVAFKLVPTVNGVDVVAKDSIIYENQSGNIYSVNNFKILISDIRINDWYYSNFQVGEYHLFDITDESSMTFVLSDSIPEFDISSISLFIGFLEEDNVTGKFPDLDNAPNYWGWKPIYGGGYHTMIMDGRYLSSSVDPLPDPYNFAIGGKRLVITQTDTSYLPNEIIASIPNSSIDIPQSTPAPSKFDLKSMSIEIRIDLNKLFDDINGVPNFNFDAHPTDLEIDAQGSEILSKNLKHPWSLGTVVINPPLSSN